VCLSRGAAALVLALAIGAATPVVEYARAFHAVVAAGKLDLAADGMKTFAGRPLRGLEHFVAADYRKSSFFVYLAR
jgi:thiazole synthase ThiGH ThiG subunit